MDIVVVRQEGALYVTVIEQDDDGRHEEDAVELVVALAKELLDTAPFALQAIAFPDLNSCQETMGQVSVEERPASTVVHVVLGLHSATAPPATQSTSMMTVKTTANFLFMDSPPIICLVITKA